MIKAYRLKHLSLHTPLKSYTLFGAFCWAYILYYGESKFETFIKDYIQNPKFLISSSYPIYQGKTLFPKPQLRYFYEDDFKIEDKLKRKPYKKARYVSMDVVKDIVKGDVKYQNDLMKKYNVSHGVITKDEIIEKEKEKEKAKTLSTILVKNSINRITNASESLYFEEGYFYDEEYFLVKFFDGFDKEFEKILLLVQEMGLGGNKNVGWGKVEIKPMDVDLSFLDNKSTNTFITLSSMIANDNIDVLKSSYNIYTFKSYTDQTFKSSILKKKVIYIEEGSILHKKTEGFCGSIKNVGFDEHVYQYGLEFPVYLEWNYEI